MRIKTYLIFLCLLTGCFVSEAQDSSYLPKSTPGRMIIYVYTSKNHIPLELQKAIDSIHGTPIRFSEIGEVEYNGRVPVKPEREFRVLNKYPDAWLLTYVHRKDKRHIHFVVFERKEGQKDKITSGISEFDIDSITTLRLRKAENKLKFVNLNSKNENHKF